MARDCHIDGRSFARVHKRFANGDHHRIYAAASHPIRTLSSYEPEAIWVTDVDWAEATGEFVDLRWERNEIGRRTLSFNVVRSQSRQILTA